MYKLVHIGSPVNLRNKLTISPENRINILPGRIKISRQSFRWRTALAWNDLSDGLINMDKLSCFKKQLRRQIIDNRANVAQRRLIQPD